MLDPMRSHGKHSTPNRESEAVAAPPGSEEVKAFFDSLAHSYRDVYCETSVYGYVLRHRRDIVTSLLPRIPEIGRAHV